MKLGVKQIILFLLIGIIILVVLWPKSKYVITEIIDGNTVRLNNGTIVKLIGVSSTEDGEKTLEELAYSQEVDLIPDRSNYFDPSGIEGDMTVYAYLCLPTRDYLCVNAFLLKNGKALLEEGTYLTDSLNAFRRYAKEGAPSFTEIEPSTIETIDYRDDDIILPPYTISNERKHSNWYVDGDRNLDMINEVCNFNMPYTKAFANQLAARSPGSYKIDQICEIFNYCYKKWRYVSDPAGQEYVASASESIAASLTGDCDDFAVLIASCIIAIGGEATIVTAENIDSGHAYAEVNITDFDKNHVLDVISDYFSQYDISSLHTRQHNGKMWLNLDWQAGYPGGPYWNCLAKNIYTYSSTTNSWSWFLN